jgi:predicted nucleic acid-binding protein
VARLILDTNIVIDFLKGEPQARAYILSPAGADISIVTWIEVLSGVTPADEPMVRKLLAGFRILQLTPRVAEEAATIRRKTRMKLSDSVIWATTRLAKGTLVTRNTKDFPATDPQVLVPYIL